MTDNVFLFLHRRFNKKEMQAWLETITKKHPMYYEEDATRMIVSSLDFELMMEGTRFQFFFCIHDGLPVGMLKYSFEENCSRIELWHFAVLPSFQRQGIGLSLLSQIQALASNRVPVFASGLLDPAHKCLQSAGFWRVKDRSGGGGPTYKWSDLQKELNDHTPGADEERKDLS